MPDRGAREVFGAFLRLGATSFGGPVAHLGYFREELVVKRRWVGERQYAELVALCQFLPGPTSSQVGFALGLIRGGYRGALAAWVAFTLPSALLLVLFAYGAVSLDNAAGRGLLVGLKAVAVAVVAHAVWGMARTLAPDARRIAIGIAAAGSALLVPGNLGQIGAVALGLVAGLLFCRSLAQPLEASARGGRQRSPQGAETDPPVPVSPRAGIVSLVVLVLVLTGLPLAARLTHQGWAVVADAFTRTGALVFGGGHVVLPLLQAEPAVSQLVPPEPFLAGYGAAQAVPGPLFSFASYLGFEMGSGPDGGPTAWMLALLALVAIFLPGFLLLVAALPFWGAIRERRAARAAVAGANAAVVGILAAALWSPVITSGITGPASLLIALGCLLLVSVRHLPVWIAVAAGAGAGILLGLLADPLAMS
ncbi:MAG: chromate efflux transporter [Leucobacter sp.]